MYNACTMSEADCRTIEQVDEIADTNIEEALSVSVAGGVYRDPDPNIVRWLNNRFKDPDDYLKATLMKAFETAGIVKTIKQIDELAKPLERSGVLPERDNGNGLIEQSVGEVAMSKFMNRREEELFLELQDGNDTRNELLERVKNATAARHLFGEEDEAKLVAFIQNFRKEHPDFTPAFRILRVMVGIVDPEDTQNAPKEMVPPETRTLAPDIYFMLLKDEREQFSAPSA